MIEEEDEEEDEESGEEDEEREAAFTTKSPSMACSRGTLLEDSGAGGKESAIRDQRASGEEGRIKKEGSCPEGRLSETDLLGGRGG